MAIAQGYTALLCPACMENQLWLGEDGLECRRCGHVVAQDNGVHALSPAVGEVPPVPGAPAEWNEGIAKAFFPTEAARAGHYRDLDVILGQLMGRKSFGEVLELGASGGAWTWALPMTTACGGCTRRKPPRRHFRIWPRSPRAAPR